MRRPVLALAAILCLGAGLRAHRIGAQSYWLDELLSLQTSTGRELRSRSLPVGLLLHDVPQLTRLDPELGWWRVWNGVQHDSHPPLYFLLLRGWRGFGDGEAATRSLSALASLAAAWLLFELARLLHGTTAALWAALLAAVSPTQILFAQEARSYSLALALLLAAGVCLVRIERLGASGRRAAALGGVSLACMLTHYYCAGVLAGLAGYALVRLRGAARRQVLAAFLLAALLFGAAWGPALGLQSETIDERNLWSVEDPAGHARRTLGRLAALPQGLIAAGGPRLEPGVGLAALAFLVPLALWLRGRREWLFWCFWLGGAIGLVTASDLLRTGQQLMWVRYSLAASPAFLALLAAGAADAPRLMRTLVPAAGLVWCVAALPAAYREAKAPWRSVGGMVRSVVRPGETLLLHSTATLAAGQLALHLQHYADVRGRPLLLVDAPLGRPAAERLREAKALWLASARPLRPERVLPGSRCQESLSWPQVVSLYRLSLDGPSTAASPFSSDCGAKPQSEANGP